MAAPEQTDTKEAENESRSIAWVVTFIRPNLLRIAGAFALSLPAVGFGLTQPYLTKVLIDDGLLASNARVLGLACLAMVGIAVAGMVVGYVHRQYYLRLSLRILFDIREAVFEHLTRLSPRYYTSNPVGDIMQRLDGDIAIVQRFATDSLLIATNNALVLVGSLAVLAGLSPRLALIGIVFIPLQLIFVRLMRPRLECTAERVRERAAHLSSFLIETLSGMKTVQAMRAEESSLAGLTDRNAAYADQVLAQQRVSYVAGSFPAFLLTGSTALAFFVGGLWVLDGSLQLGVLIAFAAYYGQMSRAAAALVGLQSGYYRARVSLRRVAAISEVTIDVPQSGEVDLPEDVRGTVTFDKVSFRYAPETPWVLDRINAEFVADNTIHLAGVSGTGKSTLIDLIHRHFDPDGGRILLDGMDIRTLSLKSLRSAIAVVEQEPKLIGDTVREFLTMGLGDIDDDGLLAACERARISERVAALPGGLDGKTGVAGRRFSGGEKQRLAIARAILQNPCILILDEAMSGVDVPTEARVIEEINTLFGNCTRIIVSHRAPPRSEPDQWFTLKEGRLLEGKPRSGPDG